MFVLYVQLCDPRSSFCDSVIVTASLMERFGTVSRLIRSDEQRGEVDGGMDRQPVCAGAICLEGRDGTVAAFDRVDVGQEWHTTTMMPRRPSSL